MMESPAAILARIARTALLVGLLGLALYGGVAMLAGLPSAQWIVTLALSAPFAGFLAFMVVDALRTRRIPVWRRAVMRDREPAAYWFHVLWLVLAAVLIGAMAIWSGVQMLAARTG